MEKRKFMEKSCPFKYSMSVVPKSVGRDGFCCLSYVHQVDCSRSRGFPDHAPLPHSCATMCRNNHPCKHTLIDEASWPRKWRAMSLTQTYITRDMYVHVPTTRRPESADGQSPSPTPQSSRPWPVTMEQYLAQESLALTFYPADLKYLNNLFLYGSPLMCWAILNYDLTIHFWIGTFLSKLLICLWILDDWKRLLFETLLGVENALTDFLERKYYVKNYNQIIF